MTLTVEKTATGSYRATLDGTAICSGDRVVCGARVAELTTRAVTTPISGSCALTTNVGPTPGVAVPANAAYDVDFATGSFGSRTRYEVRMDVESPTAYHSRVELGFVLR